MRGAEVAVMVALAISCTTGTGVKVEVESVGIWDGAGVRVEEGRSRILDGVMVAGGGKSVSVPGSGEGVGFRPVQPVARRKPMMMTTRKSKQMVVALEITLLIAANLLSRDTVQSTRFSPVNKFTLQENGLKYASQVAHGITEITTMEHFDRG